MSSFGYTKSKNLHFLDSQKLYFGTSDDSYIYHDGSDLYIFNSVGSTIIDAPNGVELQDGSSRALLVTNDGTKTTFLSNTGDYIRIGSANTTSHAFSSEDDLVVCGKLEVNSIAHFDSNVNFHMACFVSSDIEFLYGSGNNQFMIKSSATDSQVLFATYTDNQLILCNYLNRVSNYDHAQQPNPTFYIHSNVNPNTDNTQWISFVHDQTDGEIATGTGDIYLNPLGNVKFGTHNTITTETLSGYITIKDSGGTSRKIAVVS